MSHYHKLVEQIKNLLDQPKEVDEITNGVKPGGVPPFGNLFSLPVYVDQTLLENEEIIFNAGNRCFSIARRSNDYLKMVNSLI